MLINEILAERRKSLGLSQKELAAKIGVSKPRISELENRVKYSSIEKLEAILTELELTVVPINAQVTT